MAHDELPLVNKKWGMKISPSPSGGRLGWGRGASMTSPRLRRGLPWYCPGGLAGLPVSPAPRLKPDHMGRLPMATSTKKTTRQQPAPVARTARDYPALLVEIKARIQSAQHAALRSVNKELVGLYWDIGRLIVERQQREGWGKGVVEQLSADLRIAFPGVGGFSAQNLWYMRQFFQEYSEAPKLQPLVGEIGWAHNLVILSRC
jgi:hypothetical protein